MIDYRFKSEIHIPEVATTGMSNSFLFAQHQWAVNLAGRFLETLLTRERSNVQDVSVIQQSRPAMNFVSESSTPKRASFSTCVLGLRTTLACSQTRIEAFSWDCVPLPDWA